MDISVYINNYYDNSLGHLPSYLVRISVLKTLVNIL